MDMKLKKKIKINKPKSKGKRVVKKTAAKLPKEKITVAEKVAKTTDYVKLPKNHLEDMIKQLEFGMEKIRGSHIDMTETNPNIHPIKGGKLSIWRDDIAQGWNEIEKAFLVLKEQREG